MISEAEIRRLAARWQVDPMIPDLDYALGWFLAGFSTIPFAIAALRFKGGTCLRKCYFEGYRFSEDLDFTATRHTDSEELVRWVNQIAAWSAERAGPDFLAAPYRMEIVEDEYGKESFQLRVYYRGPLRWSGSPRAIRVDVTRDERLMWSREERILFHAYSDEVELEKPIISCYDLHEVLAEKVRALCGQRRFAISRDIYDIHRLIQSGVDVANIVNYLPEKFKVRGVDISALHVTTLEKRRSEFEQSWSKQLSYLIPDSDVISFEDVWQETLKVIRQLETLLKMSSWNS